MTLPSSLSKCKNMNELATFLSGAHRTTIGKHGGRKVVLQGKEYSMNQLVHKFAVLKKQNDSNSETSRKVLQKLRHLEQDQSYLKGVTDNSKNKQLLKTRRAFGHFFDQLKYGCSFDRHKILKNTPIHTEEKPIEVEKKNEVIQPQKKETPKTPPKVSEKKKEETKTAVAIGTIPSASAQEEQKPAAITKFTLEEQKRLETVGALVKKEQASRALGNPPKDINLNLQWLAQDGISTKMCDYLVKEKIVHAWAFTDRGHRVVVQLSPNDHRYDGMSYSRQNWRDLSAIQLNPNFGQLPE